MSKKKEEPKGDLRDEVKRVAEALEMISMRLSLIVGKLVFGEASNGQK